MERYKVTAEHAFDLLRHMSENSNRKLALVAQDLVATGTTAGMPPH
jgi:AmiR/NasT family two-component response regulator